MARIPVYQQRVTPNGPGAPANMQGARVASEGAGFEAIGRGIGQMADVVERRDQVDFALEKDSIETEGRIWAAKAASEADLSMAEYLKKSQDSAKPGAPGFTPGFLKGYDEYAEGAKKNAPSKFAQQLIDTHLARSREAYGKAAIAWEAAESARFQGQQIDEGVELSAKLVASNPDLFEQEMGKWGWTIKGLKLNEGAKAKMAEIARKTLAWNAVIGQIDRNPAEWAPQKQTAAATGPVGFDAVISKILAVEGGYNASDGSSNAPVNFGINQRANPDIDVKNLTKDQAIAIYKDRYWNAIGGDKLPPQLQGTAIDAAVNQGVGNAKKWLEQSGGDVVKFNELRREHYEALLKKPENAKFRNAWMGRLESYETAPTQAAPAEPADRGSAWRMLNIDEQRKAVAYAEQKNRDMITQFKESVGFRVQDATEAYERGMTPTNVPTQQELVAAYGAERGARVAGQIDAARRYGEDFQRVTVMSPTEQAQLLADRQPKPGPGFATEIARQESLSRAIAQVNQARANDPAGYAVQYSPAVSSAYRAMSAAPNDSSAVAAYAQATIAEQRRLGIADPMVMPKPMADAVARQFNDLSEGAQKPAQLIQQYSKTWGKFWPEVYRQIAKDMPPSTRVIANLKDTPAAAMLSLNSQVKTSDLRAPVPTTDAKDIDETIATALEPFRKSLVGWTTGGSSTYNDYDEAAKRNAYVYAAQGIKPKDAARRAAAELIGGYNFIGTARVPVEFNNAPINPRVIDAGMTAILKDAGSMAMRVPEAEARTFGPDFTAKQMAEAVKNKGFFVTLGNDAGVALFMEGVNGARAVEGADGQAITFTWKDLEDRAAKDMTRTRYQFDTNRGGAATGRIRRVAE